MTDEEISELFEGLVLNHFPEQDQEAALVWLAEREAARTIIGEMAAGTFKMRPTEAPKIESAG
jgi:hypothetical protein